MKYCAYALCPTPSVLIKRGRRQYHAPCARAVQRSRQREYAVSTKTRQCEAGESPSLIERRFQAALADVKRRRPFSVDVSPRSAAQLVVEAV